MNEHPPVAPAFAPSPRVRAASRLVAGLGLGLLGALLSFQMVHEPLAALGAGLGAAAVAFAAWGVIVLKDAGLGLGRAALVGALAVVGGYLGMGIVGGGASRLLTDTDTGVALLFSFWMVLPIALAFAVAVAVGTRHFAVR
jgi:hypothetical protein